MTFDEARDNVTDTEDTIIEADNRDTAGWFFNAVVTDEDDIDEDDIEEDDHQPSEYDEWQDYMGGDDWDHGQFDDCGW